MLEIVEASPTQDLTVLQNVKAELGITDNSQDAKLQTFIHQASAMAARYCNRVFGKETLRETFRGVKDNTLLLTRWPLVEIASVEIDGTVIDPDDYESDIEPAIVYRLSDDVRVKWVGSKIVVLYDAGYELLATLPYDIERACIGLVKTLHFSATRDPRVRGESIPEVIEQTFWIGQIGGAENGALPPDVVGLLDPYRVPVFS